MTETHQQATAVIPAYNEAPDIKNVLNPLQQVAAVQQIIVVDDGSTDDTSGVVDAYARAHTATPIRLLTLDRNMGKGGALMAGIQASCSDLLLLLDADLHRLQPDHIDALMQPVRKRRAEMALGIFRKGRYQTNWSHRYFSFLSGQRCLRWPAFRRAAHLRPGALARSRWGIEVALNLIARQQNLTIHQVPWEGVTHTMRLEKMSGLKKYWTYIDMWTDILKFAIRFRLHLWATKRHTRAWRRQPTHHSPTTK